MLTKLYYWLHKKISKPDERGEYSSGYWLNIVRMNVLNLCESFKGKILEVGCGEGLFLNKLAQRNKNLEIFGMDIWREIILKSKERLGESKIEKIDLVQADSCRIPFRDNFFDTVVCINVLYNLPTEEIFYTSLKEMIRVCKKEGRIIFDIRNRLNPLIYFKYRFAELYDGTLNKYSREHSLKTHRLNEVISYLKKYNVEIINIINIGFPQNKFSPVFIIQVKKG